MPDKSEPVPFEPSKWGRWQYPKHLGRWHAIAASDGSTAKLACGLVRKPPKVSAPRPGNETCCPLCRSLDDLRLTLSGKEDTSEPTTAFVPSVPVLTPVGGHE